MKKKLAFILLVFILSFYLNSSDLLTVAEKSDFKKTSKYCDVISFIKILKERNPLRMKLQYFAETTEQRKIPLVILSKKGVSKPMQARILNLPPVLIMANIHAGEVEGKEATQMLIREILEQGRDELLNNQTVLIIPIFNCDGNEKMGKDTRRDNGPELAGVRHNGQGYDLNRDYIKLESPEVRGLVQEIFNKWDPILFVDMHTTNGSYHREPVTYAPNMAPEGNQTLINYMWEKALPQIDKTLLTKYNYDSIPYGNFVKRDDPSKGWRNRTVKARYGTCYYGLRNRFSILNENYAYADFKTRVLSSLSFMKSILEYTSQNIKEMTDLTQKADLHAINNIANSEFPIQFEVKKTYDFEIKSYVFKKRKIMESERERYPKKWFGDYLVEKTDKNKNYDTTLYASFESTKKVKLTEGYILLPSERQVAYHLESHGINVQIIEESFNAEVEKFKVTNIESLERAYQGHHLNKKITYKKSTGNVEIPEGSFFVSLHQPLSILAAYMLEPESEDGLATWNFFDRIMVHQWRGYLYYPVYKILKTPNVKMHKL